MLNQEKLDVIERVRKGESLFITGKAGTGKSTLVKAIVAELPNTVIAATTGIAAVNIGGVTLHSLFNVFMPAVGSLSPLPTWQEDKTRFIKSIRRLIIDEVSMLRCDLLDFIADAYLVNTGQDFLSSIQLLFVGDMKQLPPVVREEDKEELEFQYPHANGDYNWYNANVFNGNPPQEVCLEKVFRQNDAAFLDALNKIRDGKKSGGFFNNKVDEPIGVLLASTNKVVSEYNMRALNKLKGQIITFNAEVHKNFSENDFIMEKKLELKDGCKVMYLSNNNGLYNGKVGTLKIIDHGRNNYELQFIYTQGEEEVAVVLGKERKSKMAFDNKGILKESSYIVQYPIKLAYALTIHKSQGLSLDEVTICRDKLFIPQMLYVALSRAKFPDRLYILNRQE